MEDKDKGNIYEVKIGHKNGTLSVECPVCHRVYFGNALQAGKLISCYDKISLVGCDARLRLVA